MWSNTDRKPGVCATHGASLPRPMPPSLPATNRRTPRSVSVLVGGGERETGKKEAFSVEKEPGTSKVINTLRYPNAMAIPRTAPPF